MKTVKKCIEAAKTEHKPWKTELCKFLRNYRSTPHTFTGIAPTTALFKRPMRNKLPQLSQASGESDIMRKDREDKARMKVYSDRKAYVN